MLHTPLCRIKGLLYLYNLRESTRDGEFQRLNESWDGLEQVITKINHIEGVDLKRELLYGLYSHKEILKARGRAIKN